MTTTATAPTVLPGDGWLAMYEQDDGTTSADHVLCFVVRAGVRSLNVIAYVADENRPGRFFPAHRWTNFVGFTKVAR